MSKSNPTAVSTPTDREIVITRTFDAPRELVWEAFTKPEHLVHWWGPNGFTTRSRSTTSAPGAASSR
jgi:uncharacterized protein YndB with AHSA1/START domain